MSGQKKRKTAIPNSVTRSGSIYTFVPVSGIPKGIGFAGWLIRYRSKKITDGKLVFSVVEEEKGRTEGYALVFPKKMIFFPYKLSEKADSLPFERK